MGLGGVGISTIGVVIRGDNTHLRNSLRESQKDIDTFGRQSASSLTGLNSAVTRLAGPTGIAGLSAVLGRMIGPLGLAGLGLAVAKTGITMADFAQKSQISFETMLGSAGKAKTLLSDIYAFALKTPFGFPDLVASSQRLLAFGISADNIVVTLRALGDAASGAGKGIEAVDQMSLAIGQIQAKGVLQGDELLQLSEAGVPALKMLANQAGVTAAVFSKQVTAGAVSADTAISGLIDGIENGSVGVNGATVAFGGLMDKIKTSGGWTATLDSAKAGFRNMSKAVTESAVPALTDLMGAGTGAMKMVSTLAGGFNALPGPVRDATLAFVALMVAQKMLGSGISGLAGNLRGTFATYMQATRDNLDLMGRSAGTARVAFTALGPAARAAGAGLWSAFGGPVGLAIAGISIGLGFLSSAQSKAAQATQEHEARVQSLATALKATNGLIDESIRKTAVDELSKAGTLQRAQAVGLNLATVTDAALGSKDALAVVDAALASHQAELDAAYDTMGRGVGVRGKTVVAIQGEVDALKGVRGEITGYSGDVEGGIAEAGRQKTAMDGVSDAYVTGTKVVKEFTDEQQKAIDAASEAASKAFDSALNVGAVKFQTTTADDLAAAQDKVTEATRGVRDAEQARADTNSKDKVTAADKVHAEESVQDARKALAKATETLADTEAKRDPVAQYRKQVEEMLTTARDFATNIQKLADQGLNSNTLADLITSGPAASKDQISALLADPSLIGMTNSAETEMSKLGQVVAGQAQVAQAAILKAGGVLGDNLGLGMRIAAEEGTATTLQAIADKLGQDPRTIYAVGMAAGLTFLSGFSDAVKPVQPHIAVGPGGAGGTTGYYNGGIYPGYTPGRDIGYIGISGGEAIMRPEWTRAVGPGFVDKMNAIARSGGVSAVQAAMGRYMGGFAGGGVAGAYRGAPQVVTVPVSTTIERNTPWTIQKAYFTDPAAAERFGDRSRARANRFGG
jgi:tape measure domain-containing protein